MEDLVKKESIIEQLVPKIKEEKYFECNEYKDIPSVSELPDVLPVSLRSVKDEFEQLYGVKKLYVVLNKSDVLLNGIKPEQSSEEGSNCQDSSTTNELEEERSTNENECTAVQQGILCQCPKCKINKINRNVSNNEFKYKPYACKICNFRFRYKSRLNSHMNTHDGLKLFPCNICGRSYSESYSLKKHKLTKHSSGPSPHRISCHICNKELSCKSSLDKHINNVHLHSKRYIKIPCPYCSKKVAEGRSYEVHVEAHLKKSEYICDYCGCIYFTRKQILGHIKSKHLIDPVKCDLCEHTAKNSYSLSAHKTRIHSGEYSCEICGKLISGKLSLNKHQLTHRNERPFVCQTCGKTFKSDGNLIQHQSSHSSDRPCKCDICGQSFRLRTHVKQHMAVHGIGNNYKCSICDKSFARKRECNVHMSVHYGPPHVGSE